MRRILGTPALLAALITMIFLAAPVRAALQTQAGSYHITLQTEPSIIPVGQAKLRLQVTDAAGQPVAGATVRVLTQMPGMAMGEREEIALPQPNQPGLYVAPAAFPMGGGYEMRFKILGAAGEASGVFSLQTGQNTAAGSTPRRGALLFLLVVLLLVGFVVWRMRCSGQRLEWRAGLHRQTLAGIALLLLMLFAARYAITHWRRPGAMTPLEAQGMEMNLPAPAGWTPVTLAMVQVQPVRDTVHYTGQAVGYSEQAIYPRVTGNLLWMPFYAGDRVRRGQLLARLDRSQIEPQLAQQRAARASAEAGTEVARSDYAQAQAAVHQARAEVEEKRGVVAEALSAQNKAQAQAKAATSAVQEAIAAQHKAQAQATNRSGAVAEAVEKEKQARAGLEEANSALKSARAALNEAQSDFAGAHEERETAEAEAAAVAARIPDARAQLVAAQADVKFATQEAERYRMLVAGGAVAKRELQRREAQLQSAMSRVLAAQAAIDRAQAEAEAAQSRVRRTNSAIASAEAREQNARATIEGAKARIAGATAEIAAAQARIEQRRAQVSGAGAEVSGTGARIRQMQQDARAAQAEVAAARSQVEQARAALSAGQANVQRLNAQAEAARGRIAQALAGVGQAQAAFAEVETTAGYTEIRSLLNGVVTKRLISPGTLVSPGQAILTIAQLDPIRLQANVAEADLQRVHVGSAVTVRDGDNKGKPLTTQLTTIEPAVDPQTRTGLVEAIVPNKDGRFLPGEYVVMEITVGHSVVPLSVPTSAVSQRATGEKPYVWVAEPMTQAGRFTVHRVAVQSGVSDGERIEIRASLKPGLRVVTTGYENLREGDVVTAPQSTLAVASSIAKAANTPAGGDEKIQSAAISITEKGFEPARVTLRAGTPVRLTFIRKTEATCATEVVFPALHIKKALPLNQPVRIEFTPQKSGPINYACGMDMLRGQVVVR